MHCARSGLGGAIASTTTRMGIEGRTRAASQLPCRGKGFARPSAGGSAAPASGTPTYFGIWGSGANDVWLVGRSAARRWNGSTWSNVLTGSLSALYGVWGAAANDVWAVGEGGTILHWDGARWSSIPSGTTATLRSVWGSGPGDVWAVGDNGTAVHYTL